jgi:hypothetical protein
MTEFVHRSFDGARSITKERCIQLEATSLNDAASVLIRIRERAVSHVPLYPSRSSTETAPATESNQSLLRW